MVDSSTIIEVVPEHRLAPLERLVDSIESRKFAVIVNKKSGGGRLERNPELLDIISIYLNPFFVYPNSSEESREFATYLSTKFETIISASGDGGFGAVYDGVCKGNKRCNVGAIPTGRTCFMHTSLQISGHWRGIKTKIRKACSVAAQGHTIDSKCMYLRPENVHTLCGGFGMDARMLEIANKRGGEGIWSYIVPLMKCLREYRGSSTTFTFYDCENLLTGEKFDELRFTPHDKYNTFKNKTLIFTKVPKIGPFKTFKEAKISDDFMYLYFANLDTSVWTGFWKGLSVIGGRRKIKHIYRFRAKKIITEGHCDDLAFPEYALFESMGDNIPGSEYTRFHSLEMAEGPKLIVPGYFKQ